MAQTQTDVVILGAGLVGIVTALLLQKAGMRVVVVEKSKVNVTTLPTDGRTTAISFGSKSILRAAGVWQSLEKHIFPIQEIRTFESNSPFALNFLEADKKLAGISSPLGYMIDNAKLRQELQKCLLGQTRITLVDGVEATDFQQGAHSVTVTLNDDRQLKTKLIISCEGRSAPSRARFGIQLKSWDYHHTALVGNVQHTQPHHGIAYEVFDPLGPLAFLPMADTLGKSTSAIVWSSKESLKELSDGEVLSKLHEKFTHLGEFTSINNRQYYPLKGQRVTSLIADRYVVIGDAAHVMHPIAGQGVNLGWRDSMVLAGILKNAFSYGQDIGSTTTLQNYRIKRRLDQAKLMITTDFLVRLFDIDQPFVKMVRTYGLGLVNRIPFAKKILMKQAMG